MIRSFWITVFVIVFGVVVVILPDHKKSVFNFNKDHGPSLQDLFGLSLILFGWGLMVVKTILKRKMVLKSLSGRSIVLLLVTIIAGGFLIARGLQTEKDGIMWLGVSMSIVSYAVFFIPAFRKS